MTTWQDIDPQEGGTSVRQKLNDAMNHLFDAFVSLWEVAGTALSPKDGKGVNAPFLETQDLTADKADMAGNVLVDENGELRLTDQSHQGVTDAALFLADGRLVGEANVPKYTITFKFRKDGQPQLLNGIISVGETISLDNVSEIAIELPQAATYTWIVITNGFANPSGSVTVDANKEVQVNLQPEWTDDEDTYEVTIWTQKPAGSSPTPLDGEVSLELPNGNVLTRYLVTPTGSDDSRALFEGVPDGTHSFHVFATPLSNWETYVGEITVSGADATKTVTIQSSGGSRGDDVVEGKRSEFLRDGTAFSLSRDAPTVIVQRDVNFTVSLPDATENKTVETTVRKAQAGGALTVSATGGIVMDDENKDVLTTTDKKAWAQFKSMDVSETETPDYRWVVIADSGHWTLDNI